MSADAAMIGRICEDETVAWIEARRQCPVLRGLTGQTEQFVRSVFRVAFAKGYRAGVVLQLGGDDE